MKIYSFTFSLLLLITFTNCMNPYKDYEELSTHKGNNKYEVVPLVKPEDEIKQVLLDNIAVNLLVQAFHDPIKPEDYNSYTLKIDSIGSEVDSAKTNRILKDGTNWYKNTYSNWIINGDATKKRYKYPLTKKEAENEKEWFKVFKDFYENASYVYIFQSEYYFNLDSQWRRLWYNEMTLEDNFKNHFPPKEDQDVRMVELEDHTPDFSREAFQRDTSLWTYHGYEEADREEGVGLNPINFSAGWHYLQLKMSGSEPLKIKRYGSMGANLYTYIIPEEYGGREDVVFIVQEPSNLYPDCEHGGMYVVRPRELGKETAHHK